MAEVRLPDEAWGGVDAEALLEHWAVPEGARVQAGDVLAQAVIVKTNYEIVAPASGVLKRIDVPEQSTFARGRVLATIDEG